MRKWKLAFLAGLGYSSMPAEQVIASLRKLGYDGIEWTCRCPGSGISCSGRATRGGRWRA